MNIRRSERRQVGCTIEGPKEYATRWPEYEYLCPECKRWGKGSDLTHANDDGTDSMYCRTCADKIIAETPELQ
jgi:predicted SprT family Zn-dependent metalloprotease